MGLEIGWTTAGHKVHLMQRVDTGYGPVGMVSVCSAICEYSTGYDSRRISNFADIGLGRDRLCKKCFKKLIEDQDNRAMKPARLLVETSDSVELSVD